MIEAADERLPYMVGNLAVAHGSIEAFWVADRSQVYGILPGQLGAPALGPLDELTRALDEAASSEMPCDPVRALRFAAPRMGLEVVEAERRVVVRTPDRRDEVSFGLTRDGRAMRRLALCFVSGRPTLRAVLDHLRGDAHFRDLRFVATSDSVLDIEGRGLMLRITRTENPRTVTREADRLPTGADRARKCATLLVVETAHDAGYQGVLYGAFGPPDPRTPKYWAPTSIAALGAAAPLPPLTTAEALMVCERLNAFEGTLVYDAVLRALYP